MTSCPTCKTQLTAESTLCPRCGARFPGGVPALRTEPAPVISGGSIWREGKDLVIRKNAPVLPATCIKCGRPADHRITSKLYWHSPWLYLAVLANILIYAILAMMIRKNVTLEVPVCEEHRARRKRFLWLGAAMLGLGVAVPIAMAVTGQAAFIPSAVLVFIVAGAVFFSKARLLVPRFIDADVAKVRGPCDAFMQRFPRRAA